MCCNVLDDGNRGVIWCGVFDGVGLSKDVLAIAERQIIAIFSPIITKKRPRHKLPSLGLLAL
jgi:hypothetical protein